jgi:hypothetical protein
MKQLIPILFFLMILSVKGNSLNYSEADSQDYYFHQQLRASVPFIQDAAKVEKLTIDAKGFVYEHVASFMAGYSDEYGSTSGQAGRNLYSTEHEPIWTEDALDFGFTHQQNELLLYNADVAENPTDIPPQREAIRLEEASPNPAHGQTWISYSLPLGTTHARIVLRNLLGKVVKNEIIDVNADGVRLSTGDLNNGIYIYSLIINNQAVKSKRLVVAN